MLVCPRGHNSTEPDYCSECGAKLTTSAAAATPSAPAVEACPACGAPRENSAIAFCEICGQNFAAPAPVAATVDLAAAASQPRNWMAAVSIDPALRGPGSPEPPAGWQPFTVSLKPAANFIGRQSEGRAIFPEIALPADDAVSRRHALLQLDAEGVLLLRDIGSANGTRLNGREITPMVDFALKDGDEITLGHWTRITVRSLR